MARPVKKGLDYFPLDVDFFEKEGIKFLAVECGASGISVLIKLYCNIFRNGYYVEWKEDNAALLSWDMRGMVSKDTVADIVGVCLKRKIFSAKLYEKYHILTSQDIQDIYLRALDGKRQINIIKEYWLTKIPDRATTAKVTGKVIRKVTGIGEEVLGEDPVQGGKFIPPDLDEVERYFDSKGYTQEAARKAFEYYQEGDWKDSKGKRVKNWKQKMIAVWFKPENLKKLKDGQINF